MSKEKIATQHRYIGTENPMHGLLLSSLIRIIQNIILGEAPEGCNSFVKRVAVGGDVNSSPQNA